MSAGAKTNALPGRSDAAAIAMASWTAAGVLVVSSVATSSWGLCHATWRHHHHCTITAPSLHRHCINAPAPYHHVTWGNLG